MLAAPLLAGNDVRSMSPQTLAILTNRDIIAVDQDPLVAQGHPLQDDPRVWVKPLADGAVAVALTNAGTTAGDVGTTAAAAGFAGRRLLPRARSVGSYRKRQHRSGRSCPGPVARRGDVHGERLRVTYSQEHGNSAIAGTSTAMRQ